MKTRLSEIIIAVPEKVKDKIPEDYVSVLQLFLNYQDSLSVGLTNSIKASELEMFLIHNVISHLRIYDLAEIVRVPSVAWSKFQTSKLGNKFLAFHALKAKEKEK